MKEFFKKYRHAWVLLYIFVYMAWFLILENTVTTQYHSVHIWLDDWIPFNEFFVIPYLLWFLYIAISVLYFFFAAPREEYYRYTAFLFIGMTICLIIYSIWPNGQDLRPNQFPRENLLTDLVRYLYSTDTPTNVCPSIHAFNSIAAHIAICKNKKLGTNRWIRYGSLVLMVSITLSTMFLKQHSAFDVICALILSGIMYKLVYATDYTMLFRRFHKRRNSTGVEADIPPRL